MKKILAAVLALTTIACTFASCGHDEGDEVEETSKSVSETDESSEETDDTEESETEEQEESSEEEEVSDKEESEEVTEETADESSESDKKEVSAAAEGEYIDALNQYVNYLNDKDLVNALEMMFPIDVEDISFLMYIFTGTETTLDDLAELAFESKATGEVRLGEIISVEPFDDEISDLLSESYGPYMVLSNYIKDNTDLKSMTHEEIWEYLSENEELSDELDEILENTDTKGLFNVTEGYMVTCELIGRETPQDDEETEEVDAAVYYVDGMGWKVDISMLSYIQKSRQASADSYAATIYKAANTVLTEFDEEEKLIDGNYIISSEDIRNFNIDDDSYIADFKKEMSHYIDYMVSDFNYFVVVNDRVCVFAATIENEEHAKTGTYPRTQIKVNSNDVVEDFVPGDYNYDEIYDICINAMS